MYRLLIVITFPLINMPQLTKHLGLVYKGYNSASDNSTLKFLGYDHSAPTASVAKPQEYQPAVSLSLPFPLPSYMLSHSLSFPLWSPVDRKQVLHHHFNSGVGVQVHFFPLLEIYGASSEESAQSGSTGL